MTAIAQAISAALLHFIWEGLAVAFLLWVALAMLRRSSARLRYAACCAALGIMVVLPVVTACMVYRPDTAVARSGPAVDFSGTVGPAIASAAAFLPQWITVLEAWALPVWSAGVLIFALRLLQGARYVSRLRRDGEPAGEPLIEIVDRTARRMNVGEPVRVLMSKLACCPAVVGWLRPAILIPAATLLNLSTSQLEAVLAHELAHIRRRDYLVNLLQNVAETLFFYQPAIWWVSARIRHERELCCDDLVVEVCGDPVRYARALTQLERARVLSPELAMTSTAGPLKYRIQRLAGVADERHESKAPAAFAVLLAAICLLTNMRWAQAHPQREGNAQVPADSIWVDTVKYGDLPITVRALGTLATVDTAELDVPAALAHLVKPGQSASIQLHGGVTAVSKVVHIGSKDMNGTAQAKVQLQTALTEFQGQAVDGVIRVGTLNNVTYVGRPAGVPVAGSEITIFKLQPDGKSATRVKVRLGAASATDVQVLGGLQIGDRVILSDMSKYDGYDRARIE